MRFTTKLLPSLSGNVGVLTLNNLKSLNALDADMLNCMEDVLTEWFNPSHGSGDCLVNALLVKGAAESSTDPNQKKRFAFCAGGDVKQMYLAGLQEHDRTSSESGRIGQGNPGFDTADFFRKEYVVDYMLATIPVPQISIWDGIVMGGGVGISIHGKYRVATENTVWAMPETAIGLFPDVGMLYWLSRNVSKPVATYLALTGQRLHAPDLLYTGIATHYVQSKDLPAFEQELIQMSSTSKLTDFAAPLLMSYHRELIHNDGISAPILKVNEAAIQTAFQSTSFDVKMEEIMERLLNLKGDFSHTTFQTLSKMSPTSLKLTLEGLRRSYTECSDLKDDLVMEYRMGQSCVRRLDGDFYKGVKAVLVDKNKNGTPSWNPTALEEVTDEMIQSYFEPIENEWTIPTSKM